MKSLHLLGLTLVLVPAVLSVSRANMPANTTAAGHALEAETNGYHIVLTSENEWASGDNTILVTLTDDMGVAVNNAEVQLLLLPGLDAHTESEASPHGPERLDEAMAGMDVGSGASHGAAVHGTQLATPEASSHALESREAAALMEFRGQGIYTVQAHLASTGEQDVRAMVHVDGQMLQADFVVGGTASGSRSIVVWSFAAINAAIVFSAERLRKSRLVTLKNGA